MLSQIHLLAAELRFQENRDRVSQTAKRKHREHQDVGHRTAAPNSTLLRRTRRKTSSDGHKSTSIKPACSGGKTPKILSLSKTSATATKTFPSASNTAQGVTNTPQGVTKVPVTPHFPPRNCNLGSDTEEEDEDDLYGTMAPKKVAPKKDAQPVVPQSQYNALLKKKNDLEEQNQTMYEQLNQQGQELQKYDVELESLQSFVAPNATDKALKVEILQLAGKHAQVKAEKILALKANGLHKEMAENLTKEVERLKKKSKKTRPPVPTVSPDKEVKALKETKKKLEGKNKKLEQSNKKLEGAKKTLEGEKKALEESKKTLEARIERQNTIIISYEADLAKADCRGGNQDLQDSEEVKRWKDEHKKVLQELREAKKAHGEIQESNTRLQDALKTAKHELHKSGRGGSVTEVAKDVEDAAKAFVKKVTVHKTKLVHTERDSMILKKLIEPVYEGIKEERQMENEGSVDELSKTDFGRIYKKTLLACLSTHRSNLATALCAAVGGE